METLKKLRKSRGLTTEQLAKIIHVSKRTIENYESGKTNPDFDTLKHFARFFNVTIDYLLENESDVIFITKKEYESLILLKKLVIDLENREKNKAK